MKIDLSGKTAVITGSTAGIGLAIARGLAGAGARVVVNGRHTASVERAVEALRREVPGVDAQGVVADVGAAQGCDALVKAAPMADILINNVGIFGPHDFFEIPDDEWRRFYEVNVLSGVRMARAYVPGMMTRHWGRVVFISSESAVNIPPDMVHYGMTKTANLAVSRGLAKRVAGTGVTVNAVLPGPTLSEGVAAMLADEVRRSGQPLEAVATDFVRTHRPSSIIRRAATVDEVANLVVYLASPLASATTGSALRVDGGVIDTIT
ncbi:MAG: SDR family oxidoreductase [Candidimonas sp.]|nr:MAG: SDR family oxidoreductase [Candidimonas sp.]